MQALSVCFNLRHVVRIGGGRTRERERGPWFIAIPSTNSTHVIIMFPIVPARRIPPPLHSVEDLQVSEFLRSMKICYSRCRLTSAKHPCTTALRYLAAWLELFNAMLAIAGVALFEAQRKDPEDSAFVSAILKTESSHCFRMKVRRRPLRLNCIHSRKNLPTATFGTMAVIGGSTI